MRWVWNLEGEMPRPASRPELEIRLLPVRGLKVAAGIMARTWEGYITREEAVCFLERAQGQGRLLPFVAYLGGRPVGSVLVVVRGKSAELFGGVHVLPAFRRRGVGSAVLTAVMRHLRERETEVARLYVVREMSDPPTDDDIAAAALYDRAGGARRKPLVEAVYSPQCPWCSEWLAELEEELAAADVELRTYDLWDEPERAWELLRSGGLVARGRGREGGGAAATGPAVGTPVLPLVRNVFLRVFVDGEPVGEGVPLAPGLLADAVSRALGGEAARRGESLSMTDPGPAEHRGTGRPPGSARPEGVGPQASGLTGPEADRPTPYYIALPRLADYRTGLEGLVTRPLMVDEIEAGLDLCLRRHPSGMAPRPSAAQAGAGRKRRWLESLDLPGGFFGVGVWHGERLAGLLEVYPRPVAARAGFVCGLWGSDEEVLTVACLEVAAGESRHPVMELLLEALLGELAARAREAGFRHVEAYGRYEDLAGSNPYWLFDKYGFRRREERDPGTGVILSRAIGPV